MKWNQISQIKIEKMHITDSIQMWAIDVDVDIKPSIGLIS